MIDLHDEGEDLLYDFVMESRRRLQYQDNGASNWRGGGHHWRYVWLIEDDVLRKVVWRNGLSRHTCLFGNHRLSAVGSGLSPTGDYYWTWASRPSEETLVEARLRGLL